MIIVRAEKGEREREFLPVAAGASGGDPTSSGLRGTIGSSVEVPWPMAYGVDSGVDAAGCW